MIPHSRPVCVLRAYHRDFGDCSVCGEPACITVTIDRGETRWHCDTCARFVFAAYMLVRSGSESVEQRS